MAVPIPAARAEEKAAFLPFLGPRLEAGRYAPADQEFSWVGWIGARVDLVEKGKWSAYFSPDVETVLGHRVRSFEAVQANYSLEVGARVRLQRGTVSPFFHHVSRHVQDRDKIQAVDWNFLGARFSAPWPARWNRTGGWVASLGFATLSSGVRYNWEGRISADIDVVRRTDGALYTLADIRHVGATPTAGFDRDRVIDVRAEVGYRRFQASSQLALFAAYDRRGDSLIPRALVSNRALFGFRIEGHRPGSTSSAFTRP